MYILVFFNPQQRKYIQCLTYNVSVAFGHGKRLLTGAHRRLSSTEARCHSTAQYQRERLLNFQDSPEIHTRQLPDVQGTSTAALSALLSTAAKNPPIGRLALPAAHCSERDLKEPVGQRSISEEEFF